MDQYPASANFTQLIALFLAEIIRSRRTSISRAAEISTRVMEGLKKIQNEDMALHVLSDLEKDFEEVTALKQALHFGYRESDIKVYEREVKEFAANLFKRDMVLSATFLQDAAKAGANIQQLCLKYPEFCSYVMESPEKADMMARFQAV